MQIVQPTTSHIDQLASAICYIERTGDVVGAVERMDEQTRMLVATYTQSSDMPASKDAALDVLYDTAAAIQSQVRHA